MGKKTPYNQDRVKYLADIIIQLRIPVSGGQELPQLEIDCGRLAKAIATLPKDERKRLEKTFGLTKQKNINHWLIISKKKTARISPADTAMQENAKKVINLLTTVDYLPLYDSKFQQLCNNLLKKFGNRAGISDVECLKYFIVYRLIILDGPKFFFDSEGDFNSKLEKNSNFDTYSLFRNVWVTTMQFKKDKSFNLGLVKEFVNNLELHNKIRVLQFAGFPIPPKDADFIRVPKPETFSDLRTLKEEIFPRGPWKILEILCFGKSVDFTELNAFLQNSDWITSSYPENGTITLELSSGKKVLQVYHLGELKFSDPEEIDFLYINRNQIA